MKNVLSNPVYNLIPKVKIPLPPEVKVPEVPLITPPEVSISVPVLKKPSATVNLILGVLIVIGGLFLIKKVIEPMVYPDKKERN